MLPGGRGKVSKGDEEFIKIDLLHAFTWIKNNHSFIKIDIRCKRYFYNVRDRENGKKTRDVPKNFYFVNNVPLVSNNAIN